MFNVLIDNCVWLEMAQDQKQTPLLLVVENMVQQDMLRLVVPRVVSDEFTRNRARVAQASARSLKGHVAQVKDAVNRVDGNARRKKALLAHLDDLNHRAPIVGGAAETTLTRIEKLLASVQLVEASDAAKLRAAERALQKRAPCHHDNKNSIADALLLEIYFDAVRGGTRGERFAFVSHNRSDFTVPHLRSCRWWAYGGRPVLPRVYVSLATVWSTKPVKIMVVIAPMNRPSPLRTWQRSACSGSWQTSPGLSPRSSRMHAHAARR